MGSILTTICNHSFHCSCISKWTDSSCPVCRYCQQQPEKSTCIVCRTTENLCICVICGFVGCGSNKESHAIGHWKETHHCYSLELETQRVWDYVKDNYVHRCILSKTDGKPVVPIVSMVMRAVEIVNVVQILKLVRLLSKVKLKILLVSTMSFLHHNWKAKKYILSLFCKI